GARQARRRDLRPRRHHARPDTARARQHPVPESPTAPPAHVRLAICRVQPELIGRTLRSLSARSLAKLIEYTLDSDGRPGQWSDLHTIARTGAVSVCHVPPHSDEGGQRGSWRFV